MDHIFCNTDTHLQSWYVACKSSEIKDKPVSIEFCSKKLCLFRDGSDQVIALRDRCAHLGARLSQGDVISGNIRCPFHHWEFCSTGKCTKAPGQNSTPERKVEAYPITERWGLVWIWNGPKPLFQLPHPDNGTRFLRMPPQLIRCHPHVMIVNGLDAGHLSSLHNIKLDQVETDQIDKFSVYTSWKGQFRSKLARLLFDPKEKGVHAKFTTCGGNLALAEIKSPIKFSMLFSGKGTSEGFCETQTVVFMPTRMFPDILRVMLLMYYLLHQDKKILDGMEFKADFTETDIGYELFSKVVNQMEVW